MTTYGSIPGVKIVESVGDFTDVEIGRDQYCTFVGIGGDSATEAQNSLIEFINHSDASNIGPDSLDLTTVGEDTGFASLLEDAVSAGVESQYLRGVMPELTETQEILSSTSGTLGSDYIAPSTDHITAVDDDTGDSISVDFRYESPPDPPGSADTMTINPTTAEYEFDTSLNAVDITYEQVHWEDAVDTAINGHQEGDFGVVIVCTNDEDVSEYLASQAENIREQRYGMVVGLGAATPNATMNETYPKFDAANYSNGADSDVLFLAGPTATESDEPAQATFGVGLLGRLGGKLASRATSDPVYTDTIGGGVSLRQELSRGEVETLRGEGIMPVKDAGETVTLEDNQSTFDWDPLNDWERDLFRRQAVDLVIASAYQIGRSQIGAVLDADTVSDTQALLVDQLQSFVEQGLLRAGGQSVSVTRSGVSTMDVEMRITPLGVTKSVDVSLTIDR